MSEHEHQSYDDESYMTYLPKKFNKSKHKSSSEKGKLLDLVKTHDRMEYTTTAASMQSPQSTNHTQSGLDASQLAQVNIGHLFVRQYYKSNPNTPFRKRSVEYNERSGSISTQPHFEFSPYKQIKQIKQENMYDSSMSARTRYGQNVWQPLKNIQNISFDSQVQLEKQRRLSIANTQVAQEENVEDQNLLQIQGTQSSPKKRQIFKSVFSNLLQQNKNQINVLSEEKTRVEDLQKGLVIKNLKPKTIFTNATLVQTQQNLNSIVQNQRKKYITTPNKQRIIKSSASNRPASSARANKKSVTETNQSEKQILSFISGDKLNSTLFVGANRNETPVRDSMRATNLSFYTGDIKDQKQFLDSGKNFHTTTRPKTAGSVSRSPRKQTNPQITHGQTSPHNVNILYKRLSSTNNSTLHLELEKDFSFQVLGKSSHLFSSPKSKLENQNGKKVEGGFTQEHQKELKEIESKVKEGIMSPTVNNTTVFNSRNILKKHHFVKNVADISLFEKNKRVSMHQFVFESPSPSKRIALRSSVNNNFFNSLNCVEIFNL